MHKVSSTERSFAVISLLFYGGALIPLFRAESAMEGASAEGDPVAQVIYLLIYCLTAYYGISCYKSIRTAIASNKGLLLVFALAIISLSWSDNPAVTGRRIFALVGSSLFGYYLAVRYSLTDILRVLNQSLLIGAVLSTVVAVLLPGHGVMGATQEGGLHEGAWKGIYSHKNTLGRLMVVNTLTAYLLYVMTRQKQYWITMGLALFLIIMSRSSSALVLVVFAIGFSNILKTFRLKGPVLVLMLMSMLLLMGYAGFYFLSNYELLFEYLGKDPTLTGRTLLWEHIIAAVNKRPILGYGFGGFWGGAGSASTHVTVLLNWDPAHAHNGYLEILLDVGYLGLITFFIVYLRSIYAYFQKYQSEKQPIYAWGIMYLLLFLIYNMVESTALRQNSFWWILFITTLSSYRLLQITQQQIQKKAAAPSAPIENPLPMTVLYFR